MPGLPLAGFTPVDALAIFGGFWCWLTVGKWLVGGAAPFVRYCWGGIGGLAVALGLFWYHAELRPYLWMPTLTVAAGLFWIGFMQVAVDLRDHWRARAAARDARVRAATGKD